MFLSQLYKKRTLNSFKSESVIFLGLTFSTLVTGVVSLRIMGMYLEKSTFTEWIKFNSFALLFSGLIALGFPGRIFFLNVSDAANNSKSLEIIRNFKFLSSCITLLATLICTIGFNQDTLVYSSLSVIYGIQLALSNANSSYDAATGKRKELISRNFLVGTLIPLLATIVCIIVKSLSVYLLICSFCVLLVNYYFSQKDKSMDKKRWSPLKALSDIPKSLPFFAADFGMAYSLPFAVMIVTLSSPVNNLSSDYPVAIIFSFPLSILRSIEAPQQRQFIKRIRSRSKTRYGRHLSFVVLLQVFILLISEFLFRLLAPSEKYDDVVNLKMTLMTSAYVFLMAIVQFHKLDLIAKRKLMELSIIWPIGYLTSFLVALGTRKYVALELEDALLLVGVSIYLSTVICLRYVRKMQQNREYSF